MRLRLKIRRHGLPTARVMWTVDRDNEGYSIADLLQELDDVIPLESDDWGLEDYTVESTGYGCLHFQLVRNVLQDLDLVE